jgi:hypothetical protein
MPRMQARRRSVLSTAIAPGFARYGLDRLLHERKLAAHSRPLLSNRLAKANAKIASRAVTGGAETSRPHRRPGGASYVAAKSIPAIIAGGEDISLTPVSFTSLGAFEPTPYAPSAPARPLLACADETLRIRNYASRAIDGIVAHPGDDLQLFSADGKPGRNLAPLMVNMARVEIGPFAARADLISAAIAAAFPAKGSEAEAAMKSRR